QLGLAATHEHRLGPQHAAVGECEPTLFTDGEQRADQVLAVAHTAGRAIDHDPDWPAFHGTPFVGLRFEPRCERGKASNKGKRFPQLNVWNGEAARPFLMTSTGYAARPWRPRGRPVPSPSPMWRVGRGFHRPPPPVSSTAAPSRSPRNCGHG